MIMATKDNCIHKNDHNMDNPDYIEGWLKVWELDHHAEQRVFEDGKTPRPIWDPYYCVLCVHTRRLSHFVSEKVATEYQFSRVERTYKRRKIRLDGGKQDFDKRWGYEALESIKENVLQHSPMAGLDVFGKSQTLDNRHRHNSTDAAYEKGMGERRGSVPAVSTIHEDSGMESPSTPSRFANFFNKKLRTNLKRTKSVTKLERNNKKSPYNNDVEGSLINTRMRSSRSYESLVQSPLGVTSIDLSSPDIEIKPLHSSMLGQEHGFQVTTSNGSKYYSCRSAEERHKWIQHLRKTVQPNQEQTRRTDNSLKLWVLEAKTLPAKKRYFCEVCLDRTLYSRTSAKTKGDMLFWGEHFEFNNVPAVETVTVNLYREAEKKKKKEKNTLIGYIHIPVADISSRQLVEKWYTTRSAVVGKAGKENKNEMPVVRIKARFQCVNILPMYNYTQLTDYIETDYNILVDVLEPILSVKAKEELATCLVNVVQKRGKARDFLGDIVLADVNKLENENLTFRGNSIATKAMEAFMKLVGDKYIQDTLGEFIKTVLESGDDLEVDPTKVNNNNLLVIHQQSLISYCEIAWFKIINSFNYFPSDLKAVFASFRNGVDECRGNELADNLISSCIFLRFLCPAILSPSLFNLTQEFPQEKGARNLTLIAKTIQTLANFSKFGAKEEFMTFMNDFVDRERQSMKNYLKQISSVVRGEKLQEYDGFIDLGRELSVLHTVLSETKLNETSELKLGKLAPILSDIQTALDNPDPKPGDQDNAPQGSYSAFTDTKVYQYNIRGFDNPHRNGSTSRHASQASTVSDEYVTLASVTSSDYVMDERLGPSQSTPNKKPNADEINVSWGKMVNAANLVNGNYVDLISFADDAAENTNSSLEIESGADQTSTIASSGYQSFGGNFSQSNSPVETVLQESTVQTQVQNTVQQNTVLTTVPSTVSQNNTASVPLSFANPLFGSKVLRQTSIEGRPAHVTRSPSNSSMSSEESARRKPMSLSSSQKYERELDRDNVYLQPSVSEEAEESSPIYSNSFSLPSVSSESISSRTLQNGGYNVTSQPQNGGGHMTSQHSQSAPYSLGNACLSKSADFGHQATDTAPPHGIKKTVTHIGISQSYLDEYSTPPSVECYNTVPAVSGRGARSNANTVRMGVSSVQRKQQEQEKSKTEYEQELNVLKRQLCETQQALADTQRRLFEEKEGEIELLNARLAKNKEREEEKIKEREHEMQEVINRSYTRLKTIEKEKEDYQRAVRQKQHIIQDQEQQIRSLDAANNKLLLALSSLKDRYHLQNRNGAINSPKLSLATENGSFKSSHC